MLGYGNYVLCAGAGEEVDPFVGVEFFGAEHGDEVFVAELGERAVGGDLMRVGGAAGDVDVAGVPLVGEGGDGVDAPVEEDAELGVLEPGGSAVGGEGVPVGVEGAALIFGFDGGDLLLDFGGEVLRVSGGGECGDAEGEEAEILHEGFPVLHGEKVCLVKCETGKVEVLEREGEC